MAETTKPPEQRSVTQQPQPARPADQSRPRAEGERERERDEADRQIAEHLAKAPETPQPTQEEADEIRERALAGGVPREQRQAEQRDVRPDQGGPGYTTR